MSVFGVSLGVLVFQLSCMPQWCVAYEGIGNTANYMYQIECMFNANSHRTFGKPLSWDAVGLQEKTEHIEDDLISSNAFSLVFNVNISS